MYCDVITHIIKEHKRTNTFPNRLKNADINPSFKPGKKNRVDIGSYRPLSVLPHTSKKFERDLKKQIQESIDSLLHPNLCGYHKGFSAQHALISLLEKWKKQLDKR